jgi:lysophospholipase L1-like esterase
MLNRRLFIKGSAAAGLIAACSPAQAMAQARSRADVLGGPGYSYRLPGFPAGSRLVFQGDSITDMARGRNEGDRNHYLGHGYVYLIAARLGVECAADQLNFFNRGVGSNMMPHLKERWQRDSIESQPDLLSILFGVNDVHRMFQGTTAEDWDADYRSLLDASRAANPELKLVLLDPFVLASGPLANPDQFRRRRDQIDRLTPVVEQLAKDYDAVHVRTQAIFDAAAEAVSPGHWIWDGVHPLPCGHELIARAWLEATSARWRRG